MSPASVSPSNHPKYNSLLVCWTLMANQENRGRIILIEKKRSAAAIGEAVTLQLPSTKKRVILEEISNSPSGKQGLGIEAQTPKCRMTVKNVRTQITTVKNFNAKTDTSQMYGAYFTDIYEHLRKVEKEPKRRPLPDYMKKIQKDMNANMREILLDWVVDVAEEYKLVSDTLFLTISYIDRFLSMNALAKEKLQLLGVASMYIASKYVEINPPYVGDFCYITDYTYNKQEVLKMEAEILKSHMFEMDIPTTKLFLRRFNLVAQQNYETTNLELEFLGDYLAELSLLDYSCLKFLPSLIAASVVFLSRLILHPKAHPWSSPLQHHSGYKSSDLKECVLVIHALQLSKRAGAVRDKYSQNKFKSVAMLSSPSQIPFSYFEDVSSFPSKVQDVQLLYAKKYKQDFKLGHCFKNAPKCQGLPSQPKVCLVKNTEGDDVQSIKDVQSVQEGMNIEAKRLDIMERRLVLYQAQLNLTRQVMELKVKKEKLAEEERIMSVDLSKLQFQQAQYYCRLQRKIMEHGL